MGEVKIDKRVETLKNELKASMVREEVLKEKIREMQKGPWLKEKIDDPNSKLGWVIRLPRSIYRVARYAEVREELFGWKNSDEDNEKGAYKNRVRKGDLAIEPWWVDLETRVKILEKAKKSGKKIAMYYAEVPDGSTFRYRSYNTFRATEKSKIWQAVFFTADEKEVIKKWLPEVNLFVIGRQSGYSEVLDEVIVVARKAKKQVVLDIDDLVFDEKYLRMVLNTIGQLDGWDYWEEVFNDNYKIAKKMDGFLVTNEFLGEKISGSFKKPYRIIRNSLNKEQIEASQAYLQVGVKNKKFDIGYFSGSPTHANDLAEALPEVITFLEDHEDARLLVAGMMDFGKDLRKFFESGRMEFLEMTDFRKLQRLMAEVDVNIAPLVINDFTNCKSELKFFEAAVVETTTIASPTYTFAHAITDGENGYLAQPGEWYEKLEYLYQHPEVNRGVALAAKKYALKHYYGKEFLVEVEEAYDYFGD